MKRPDICLSPIGVIHSPHKKLNETPIQPVFARGVKGTVVLDPKFAEGLNGLEKFSHIYLFFYFHMSEGFSLSLKPFLQDKMQGVFATRAPSRPNPLGFSVVKLLEIEDNILYIQDVDILDSTPLIDIKPYVERFDKRDNVSSGWQEEVSDDDAHILGKRAFKGK
ncbi:MAG: tRNA (N6-threonylcarbamoyladenosine(37)-N6)-methyltransferase TrmO [Thermodesulfobacteriota bacterium]|nr:tRNA (N6-threonylcarbamoyladenosine(37)-N6)-methyltransferase TrmO [Thermodesulfobacteriota bacterium]